MIRRRFPRGLKLLAIVVAFAGAIELSAAEDESAEAPQPRGLPAGIAVEANHIEQNENGDFVLEGSVTLSWERARLQADRIVITGQRYLEADGHVLLVWQENRVAGTRATYDIEEDYGVIEDAIGQVSNEYYFWAERAEKIGEDKIHLDSATVTSCTQPVPYWSFSVSSANIRINSYARMWNTRLKTGKMPVFYLPYLIWPVKRDRAAGLLFPEFRRTSNRGRVINQRLFIPLGPSADLMLLGRYYTEAGFGGGGTLRVIPNRAGSAELSGFYIQDKVATTCDTPPCGRYRAAYRQTQKFRNGFRMVADINLVSDFNYFSDFERELNLVSSPTILARLEFSRNGRWTSLNVRELRREQLFSSGAGPASEPSLVQQTLPEIEWRARNRRLGKTPFYLAFESSAALIQQSGLQQNLPIDADYLRADFFPTLSVPISKIPWIDITPAVNYRITHWTQQQQFVVDPVSGLITGRDVLDEGLTRTLFGVGLEIVGPKLFRTYKTPNSRFSKAYKHSIEPHLSYGFLEDFERPQDVLLFDEIDRFTGAGAAMSYGLRTRLFAKRPRAKPTAPAADDTFPLPGGQQAPEGGLEQATLPTPPEPLTPPSDGEPVEIASLELRQSRSFERDLSIADVDGDGDLETSPYSPVQLTGRFNPTPAISLDVRSTYDILHHRVRDVSFSGGLRNRFARARFSLVHREGLGLSSTGVPNTDDTQLRLTTGFSLFRNKLHLGIDGSVDFNPLDGESRFPQKQWRVVYATQCCTFLVEKLDRDFSALDTRRDWYFQVDLRGVGRLLKLTY